MRTRMAAPPRHKESVCVVDFFVHVVELGEHVPHFGALALFDLEIDLRRVEADAPHVTGARERRDCCCGPQHH